MTDATTQTTSSAPVATVNLIFRDGTRLDGVARDLVCAASHTIRNMMDVFPDQPSSPTAVADSSMVINIQRSDHVYFSRLLAFHRKFGLVVDTTKLKTHSMLNVLRGTTSPDTTSPPCPVDMARLLLSVTWYDNPTVYDVLTRLYFTKSVVRGCCQTDDVVALFGRDARPPAIASLRDTVAELAHYYPTLQLDENTGRLRWTTAAKSETSTP